MEGVVVEWILPVAVVALGLLACTGAFFFVTTRGALLVRALLPARDDPAAHVYPIYANARLIRLVDFQPIIAAILLFQYDRLVSIITRRLRRMELRDRDVLVTSCAFGNVMPRVARASLQGDARTVKVVDIIENELIHAQRKMTEFAPYMSFTRGDAAARSSGRSNPVARGADHRYAPCAAAFWSLVAGVLLAAGSVRQHTDDRR